MLARWGGKLQLTPQQFEELLNVAASRLTADLRRGNRYHTHAEFEQRVRTVLANELAKRGKPLDLSAKRQSFPDIVVAEYGVEVKFTENDTWRSVANSVFEGTRSVQVKQIYVVFGKVGGLPEVRWGRYEDCVMHVRTSHVPRFELEMCATQSLFEKFGITYKDFSQLAPEAKMKYVRRYARERLKPGERLWWLDDSEDPEHSLPLEVRLYMRLPQKEKRQLRAEAALLCPQIVKGSRVRDKYNDAVLYLLTYHGVLCPQARDLFSAGSVALRASELRGGIYIMRALEDIQDEMIEAAHCLEDALFQEYWGQVVPRPKRIDEWLRRADAYASGWVPSKILFRKNRL